MRLGIVMFEFGFQKCDQEGKRKAGIAALLMNQKIGIYLAGEPTM